MSSGRVVPGPGRSSSIGYTSQAVWHAAAQGRPGRERDPGHRLPPHGAADGDAGVRPSARRWRHQSSAAQESYAGRLRMLGARRTSTEDGYAAAAAPQPCADVVVISTLPNMCPPPWATTRAGACRDGQERGCRRGKVDLWNHRPQGHTASVVLPRAPGRAGRRRPGSRARRPEGGKVGNVARTEACRLQQLRVAAAAGRSRWPWTSFSWGSERVTCRTTKTDCRRRRGHRVLVHQRTPDATWTATQFGPGREIWSRDGQGAGKQHLFSP